MKPLLEFDAYSGPTKVISGGQTGADIAGLIAAAQCGIPTGGTAPNGWRTQTGANPDLETFGLVEHSSRMYQPRTLCNVRDSDATIIFAVNFNSPGTLLTVKYVRENNKPMLKVQLPVANFHQEVERIDNWLCYNQIDILNVAGNAERPHLGENFIRNQVIDILTTVFTLKKDQE